MSNFEKITGLGRRGTESASIHGRPVESFVGVRRVSLLNNDALISKVSSRSKAEVIRRAEEIGILQTQEDYDRLESMLATPGPDDSDEEKQAPQRRVIRELSFRSRQRLAVLAANSEDWSYMTTLTYHDVYPLNGRALKMHLDAFLQHVRRTAGSYLWFLEFQKRGAPHFHILTVNQVPNVLLRWRSIVGDQTITRANCEQIYSKMGGCRYVTKYCYKMEQKQVPDEFQDVGRFWGAPRSVKVAVESVELPVEFLDMADCDTYAANGTFEYSRVQFNLSRWLRRYAVAMGIHLVMHYVSPSRVLSVPTQ